MKKFKILKDKNGGIYDIVDAETKERTEPLKRALNMFKGQPLSKARKECVYYVTQCILGNEEEISRLHYIWNNPVEKEEV